MFRRQLADRINPRNVLPSRHTIFIRGLPGSTDVTKVKEYFSTESDSKCSVDFFSTSDDKKRLSIAIRFKSHDLAKEMLTKYHNKILLGFPVEITWFKDYKKAKAKVFEEQRQSGRHYQRAGYRSSNRNDDRRAMAVSPNGYDGGHRARTGSSSSGGMGRQNLSRSRSRSFTGSSSRSVSRSPRSASASPHIRRMSSQNLADNSRGSAHGFQENQPTFGNRRRSMNQSRRSASASSSSSRSPSHIRSGQNPAGGRLSSTTKSQQPSYPQSRGNASPLNYGSSQRTKPMAASNQNDYTSFTNAPAPDPDGGSSLVSGLIQLKRRSKTDAQFASRRRHPSVGSSSSGLSGASPRRNIDLMSGRTSGPVKPVPSLSPAYGGMSQLNYKSHDVARGQYDFANEDAVDIPRRKRQKRAIRSPGSSSPYGDRLKPMDVDSTTLSHKTAAAEAAPGQNQRKHKLGRDLMDESLSSEDINDLASSHRTRRLSPSAEWGGQSPVAVSRQRSGRSRRATKVVDDVPREESVESELSSAKPERFLKRPTSKADNQDDVASVFKESIPDAGQEDKVDDTFDLIRQHKETLAQDYKRDCEAFTTVVQTLISKDAELENRLMPMLKEILHERGQRCIEDLRSFIADHQPGEMDGKPVEPAETSAA